MVNTSPPGERLLEVDEAQETDVTDSGAGPAAGRLVVREEVDVEEFPSTSPVEDDQRSNQYSTEEVVDDE